MSLKRIDFSGRDVIPRLVAEAKNRSVGPQVLVSEHRPGFCPEGRRGCWPLLKPARRCGGVGQKSRGEPSGQSPRLASRFQPTIRLCDSSLVPLPPTNRALITGGVKGVPGSNRSAVRAASISPMTAVASLGVMAPSATAASTAPIARFASPIPLIAGNSRQIVRSFRGGTNLSMHIRRATVSPARPSSIAFRGKASASPSGIASAASAAVERALRPAT
jgi:hypothetical protein